MAERRTLSQVQFCVPGKKRPCNAKGEYFIADLVFVKYDRRGTVVDMVVADSKLSLGTKLTDGQELAKNGIGQKLTVRSAGFVQDALKKELPKPINQGTGIKIDSFLKIYGDGAGKYRGIE